MTEILCEVCDKELSGHYCTLNICEECCKSEKCPARYRCRAWLMGNIQ